ncbi:hypothetical protein EHS13_25225 [Paenibacillus psychroresistens]|uniref:SLH domain-containing protein n=1 Tax=Paenibacillus psychroresistens TaxID=1778678 RepID=A0A6B8RRD9_9BACL|nr:S-layer homology domain-containing protein [Paenibacillus psychroresistens]QGQ97956.1 hypothetical protein EHS13_25225 [Paenibacillus psychroresistens]
MKNKSVKKSVVFLVMLCLIFSSFGTVFGDATSANAKSDIKGHWAEAQIATWIDKGFIKGYEGGSFKPNNSISRAEFMALINRSFGFTEKDATVSFSDVASTNWAYVEAAIAVKAGYIEGYADGTIGASKLISRQEVAVIVDRLLGLTKAESPQASFTDSASIASWAKFAVDAAAAKEILKGYAQDNSFKPTKSITRAEAVVTLDRAIAAKATVYNTAGTKGPTTGIETINGNVVIEVPGVILQNLVINGDLLFAAGIGSGDATLNNVTVKGQTRVEGGGENSIHINNSIILTIIVDKKNGTVRIVAEGSTTVGEVTVQSPTTIQETGTTGTGFSKIVLSELLPADSTVTLKGTFDSLDIKSDQIEVNIPEGSVAEVTAETTSTGLKLNLGAEAKIINLILNAVAKILGTGTIDKVTVSLKAKDGTTFEKPATVTIYEGEGTAKPTPTSTPTPTTVPTPTTTPTSPPIDPEIILISAISVTSEGDLTQVANGQALQLSAAVTPANATNKTVTWSVVSGPGTIDTSGVLTATGIGTITVKAVAQDGSLIEGSKVITAIVAPAAIAAALLAINTAQKDAMKTTLETNAEVLGLTFNADYFNVDFIAKSRQISVTNYVYDSKAVTNGSYATSGQIQVAINNGIAYEKAKLALSTKFNSGSATIGDLGSIQTAYLDHGKYRGYVNDDDSVKDTAEAIFKTSFGTITSFLLANSAIQNTVLAIVNTSTHSVAINPYKINDVFAAISSEMITANAKAAALTAINTSLKENMKTTLEVNAEVLGLTFKADYFDADFIAKSRQTSVTNYVYDSKAVSNGSYATSVQIQDAIDHGIDYEKTKLALSTIFDSGSATSEDIETIQAAYLEHGEYRGYVNEDGSVKETADSIFKTSYGTITKFLLASHDIQVYVLYVVNGSTNDSYAINPYKINDVFARINIELTTSVLTAINDAANSVENMKAAIAANSALLNLPTALTDDYMDTDFIARNRQNSVAQYLIDWRIFAATGQTYSTETQIVDTFVNAVGFETAKLTFSTKAKAGSLDVAALVGMKAAYSASGIYFNEYNLLGEFINFGVYDTTFKTAIEALIGAIARPEVLDFINEKYNLDGADEAEPGDPNPYKINTIFSDIAGYFVP